MIVGFTETCRKNLLREIKLMLIIHSHYLQQSRKWSYAIGLNGNNNLRIFITLKSILIINDDNGMKYYGLEP